MTPSLVQEDVRDLLGMRTRLAWVVVATYITAMTIVAAYQLDTVTHPGMLIAALVVFSAAALAVVRAGTDPLSTPLTVGLVAAGPVGCALALYAAPAIPLSALLFTWVHGAGTTVYCFMNVRGRFFAPWIGLAAMIAVAALWATDRALSPAGASLLVAVDAAPLVMSAMFARTLRPAAREVFTLRARTTRRVADTAAAAAAAAERSHQADRLNNLARPLLNRIASAPQLTDDERSACATLEAHLRDQLRAPLLSHLGLDVEAYRARTRGVDVILIDDTPRQPDNQSSPSTAVNADVVTALRTRATHALAAATAGRVVVRISPPGNEIAASVLVRDAAGNTTRTEIDRAGQTRDY